MHIDVEDSYIQDILTIKDGKPYTKKYLKILPIYKEIRSMLILYVFIFLIYGGMIGTVLYSFYIAAITIPVVISFSLLTLLFYIGLQAVYRTTYSISLDIALRDELLTEVIKEQNLPIGLFDDITVSNLIKIWFCLKKALSYECKKGVYIYDTWRDSGQDDRGIM